MFCLLTFFLSSKDWTGRPPYIQLQPIQSDGWIHACIYMDTRGTQGLVGIETNGWQEFLDNYRIGRQAGRQAGRWAGGGLDWDGGNLGVGKGAGSL